MKTRKGFTLVEAIIMIAIVVILIMMVVDFFDGNDRVMKETPQNRDAATIPFNDGYDSGAKYEY